MRGRRKLGGKNRELNAPGHIQFFSDLAQILVSLQAAPRGHISQADKKKQKAQRLDPPDFEIKLPDILKQRKRRKNQQSAEDHHQITIRFLFEQISERTPHTLQQAGGTQKPDEGNRNEVGQNCSQVDISV